MQKQVPPIQPILENEHVRMEPLEENDFEILFQVASDPKVWEQHPNSDRYRKDVFATFFQGALASKSAFKIWDRHSGEWAGGTRYHDFNPAENSICIGYTFYGTKFWGTGLNPQVKKLMLDYIFQYVDTVYLHVGAYNIRSQIAVQRLGAVKVGEVDLAPEGKKSNPHFIYAIPNPKPA